LRTKGQKFLACGIISGTSRDGIDVALIEISGRFPKNGIRLIHAETTPYRPYLKRLLMKEPQEHSSEGIMALDFLLGEVFGRAALKAVDRAGLGPKEIDVIGSHGQTILHRPRGVMVGRTRVKSTLQLGCGAVIAQRTGIATVSGFRAADIAVGGEGAPLVPVFDYAVLHSRSRSRVALNVGGIANVTAIPRDAGLTDVIGFDTGPGNSMIDTAARVVSGGKMGFDRDGMLASRGEAAAGWVRAILAHPYFRKRPPKSTGWEEFGWEFTRGIVDRMDAVGFSRSDILRTVTEAVSRSVVDAIKRFVVPAMGVDEIVVTGGGSRNPVLMDCLRGGLSPAPVETGQAFGLDCDAKEACAFAYLAYLAIKGIPANIVSQASGLKPAILGSINFPGSEPNN
jgi:anhydro-N-acetylmuramic acid kinase